MNRQFACSILTLLVGIANPAALPAGEDAAAEQIREARSRFNLAIEERQAERIAEFIAPGYVLVTGRGDRFDSREANVDLWRSTFLSDPTFNCRRTPDDVIANADWGLAQETGRWTCTQTVDGEPGRYTGIYAAKWQRAEESAWLLQAEVFTTLTCDGPESTCRRPDSIVR